MPTPRGQQGRYSRHFLGGGRELLDSMDAATIVGLRDCAIVAVMAFTFARVSAVVGLRVEDYYPQKKRWWLRLREQNGKVNEMPWNPTWTGISRWLASGR